MKRVLVAVAVLAVTVLPSFAADGAPDKTMGHQGNTAGREPMRQMMQQHPEVMREMMRNPHHLLAMTYHKSVIAFARALDRVARQGDTVPTDFARTAIAEMRRSTDEMEKHRAQAMAGIPADMRGQMQKQMDEHLVAVKSHLRALEELSRRDRIPSSEVLSHLQPLLVACDGDQCQLPRRGMPGGGGMHGCRECQGMMAPEQHKMMHEMTQNLKAQDDEMLKLVARMKRASGTRKIDLMSDIVSRIVQQRADMTAKMEKMQQRMMEQHRTGGVPPDAGMAAPGSHSDDEGAGDDNDMNMQDMNM